MHCIKGYRVNEKKVCIRLSADYKEMVGSVRCIGGHSGKEQYFLRNSRQGVVV